MLLRSIALSEIKEGDIVLNGVNGWQGTAAVGDRIAGMIKNNGGKGLVTDGPMRDLNGVIETGLDCFCTGLNPNSPFNSGPAKIGFPLHIGGKTVNSGDMIIADTDGVTVVPFDKIDEVISRINRIIEIENDMDAKVSNGLKISQSAPQGRPPRSTPRPFLYTLPPHTPPRAAFANARRREPRVPRLGCGAEEAT